MRHHRAYLDLATRSAQIFVVTNQILIAKKNLTVGRTVELITVHGELVLLVDIDIAAGFSFEQLPNLFRDPLLILGPVRGDADPGKVANTSKHIINGRIIFILAPRESF